ncbi:ATP-binding protein [Massilia solisilvae]|uniref:histidine kinase n=1 Tax=Massilia solisilvae TaxID=1811225 RepID=A0ABT2BL95_9BURK|nr:hybrid sensor histidine kinase/response regulator [Massilia solisilvae]MCS0609247.1 ATP-binding protein [Massilia solisilvae]
MINRLKSATPAILLCAFAAMLIAGVWLTTTNQIREAREHLLETASHDAASLARLVEEHSVRTIHSADQAVQFIKHEYKEHGAHLDLATLVADGVILNDIFNLYSIVGPDGDVLLSDKPFAPVNLSDREHIRVHREHQVEGLYISKPVLGRVSQKWSMQLTRRIDGPGGRFGGVVVVSMDPFYFTRLYESARIGPHSSVALVGDDGIVRARRSGNLSEIGQNVSSSKLFHIMRANLGKVFIRTSVLDGRERVYTARRVEGQPLMVVVGIDTADVLDGYEPLRIQLLLEAAGVTLAIAIFTLLLLILFRDLVRSRAQALSASAAKSQFLSNMSHELRTPLNGILGYAELLHEDLPQGSEQHDFARFIHESGTHLLALVNQVLQLNKIESGNERVTTEVLAVRPLVQQAANAHRSSAMAKGLALDFTVEPDTPELIVSDRLKLTQVLNNLLHNAVKFTETGSVRLEVHREGDRLRFAVSDTGPGIPVALQGKIFEKFFQVDAQAARHNDGTGLGLALVSELVRMLGGELTLASETGRGTTIAFTIPCVLPPQDGDGKMQAAGA